MRYSIKYPYHNVWSLGSAQQMLAISFFSSLLLLLFENNTQPYKLAIG